MIYSYYKILNFVRKKKLLDILYKFFKFLLNLRYRWDYRNMIKKKSISERFTQIYDKNLWRSYETRSGEGSEIHYTRKLRSWLIKKILTLKIKNFVDAPCGDFNWMKEVLFTLNKNKLFKYKFNYFGFDIVEKIINKNNLLYKNKNINFKVANICQYTLPNCDILMVRDFLFHLSYEDINKFLKNIRNVNYKYLLTTTHIDTIENNFKNSDIISGDARFINLFAKPFNFNNQDVIDRVKDCPNDLKTPKEMILIKKKNVPTSINF